MPALDLPTLVQTITDLTGRVAIASEVAHAIKDRDALLHALSAFHDRRAVARTLRRNEGDFYALIESEAGRLRGQIARESNTSSDVVEVSAEGLREIEQESAEAEKYFAELAGVSLTSVAVHNDERHILAVAALAGDVSRGEVQRLKVAERWLRKLKREHRAGTHLQALRQHGGKIWWSLAVATLLIGFVTDAISYFWIRMLAIPVVLWAIQQFAFEPWLARRARALEEEHLRSRILHLCECRIRAICVVEMTHVSAETIHRTRHRRVPERQA